MTSRIARASVPSEALLSPTLMLTGRSATSVYAQPAAQLARLVRTGAIVKLARGFYAAVPVGKTAEDWSPSLEDISAGIATAVFGYGQGALCDLSAARVHGALPRAQSLGHVCGPTQHRPLDLVSRPGRVIFHKRESHDRALEYLPTELGPARVTTVAQTILDLSSRPFEHDGDSRSEAVRLLMNRVDERELTALAARVRGRTALSRARKLAAHVE